MSPPEAASPTQKSAMYALAGLPNAGKSTLINSLTGNKLSIVSHHPHTTRRRVVGVCYHNHTQLVLCDTPGLSVHLDNAMQRAMQSQIHETLQGVDLLVWIMRVDRTLTPPKQLAGLIAKLGVPLVIVLNQVDRLKEQNSVLPLIADVHHNWSGLGYRDIVPVSARCHTNTDRLKAVLASHAPHLGWLYDNEQQVQQPEWFTIAEIIREKVLWHTRKEIPHAVGVDVEKYEKKGNTLHIHALIRVEREGQKVIIIGKKGHTIKSIGTQARTELESYFATPIMLTLFVQVRRGWCNDATHLAEYFHF